MKSIFVHPNPLHPAHAANTCRFVSLLTFAITMWSLPPSVFGETAPASGETAPASGETAAASAETAARRTSPTVETVRQAVRDSQPTPWSEHAAGDTVAVTTRSGRVVRGSIDRRTSDRFLWVTASVEGMTVGSRHPVSDVVRVESAAPLSLPPSGSKSSMAVASRVDAASDRDVMPPPLPDQAASRLDAPPGVPTSLAAAARLDSWDGDPEPDGLRLFLFPRDRDGNVVPAAGSVTISLQVYRGDWRDISRRMRTAESWTREVQTGDYVVQRDGLSGVVVDLPFRRIRPETDTALSPVGTLKVRFRVPGRGTFDATIDDVELRPYSFTRELRQRG